MAKGIGWICADPKCADREARIHGWRQPISSLVRSNFKFTKEQKPICLRCWREGKYTMISVERHDQPAR